MKLGTITSDTIIWVVSQIQVRFRHPVLAELSCQYSRSTLNLWYQRMNDFETYCLSSPSSSGTDAAAPVSTESDTIYIALVLNLKIWVVGILSILVFFTQH